jgi:DNA-binding transcriptional regulator GbsR (MarR family)
VVANGLPVSCSKVLEAIAYSGQRVCQQEILEITKLSERSIKYALKSLKQMRLVSEFTVLSDVRRKLYSRGETR